MGQFRSRHIRAKYEKLKKKQLDIKKQQNQNNLKKKNWLIANAIIDFNIEKIVSNLKKEQIFSYTRSNFDLNSHPFVDATVKFDGLKFWLNQIYFNLKSTVCGFNIEKQNGIVFFVYDISFFFVEILPSFNVSCYTQLSYNKNKFFFNSKGYYIIVTPQKSGDFLSLILSLITKDLFLYKNDKFLLLGFFFQNNFYFISLLTHVFNFYQMFFFAKIKDADLNIFEKEITLLLNEINDVVLRREIETTKETISSFLLKKYDQQDFFLLEQSKLKKTILNNQFLMNSFANPKSQLFLKQQSKTNLFLTKILTTNLADQFIACFYFIKNFLK